MEWHPCWSHCGRRTSTFLSCAFREQGISTGVIPFLFIVRVLRARRAPGHSSCPYALFSVAAILRTCVCSPGVASSCWKSFHAGDLDDRDPGYEWPESAAGACRRWPGGLGCGPVGLACPCALAPLGADPVQLLVGAAALSPAGDGDAAAVS